MSILTSGRHFFEKLQYEMHRLFFFVKSIHSTIRIFCLMLNNKTKASITQRMIKFQKFVLSISLKMPSIDHKYKTEVKTQIGN